MVKVLVADDSSLMRKAIARILSSSGDIEIIGFASNGREAVEKNLLLRPDVVTMDVEMPVLDGVSALSQIMIHCPTPVVMISSMTRRATDITMQCLMLGAVDFIEKPSSYSGELEIYSQIIIDKVRNAYKANVKSKKSTIFGSRLKPRSKRTSIEAVIIGVSTGGPKTLNAIIPHLPADLGVAIFVVQHMPPLFTKSFADGLNRVSQLSVKEAEQGEHVKRNMVYVAPGGRQMQISTTIRGLTMMKITAGPEDAMYKPCIDITAYSVAEVYRNNTLGVMLTGMGTDGSHAFEYIKKCGGTVIAESESTAVIFGMPQAVIKAGNADYVLASHHIAEKIVELVY